MTTEPKHRLGPRLARFGRNHPALTMVGIAGIGLVGGVEMAAGVVLGAGVLALIQRPREAEVTEVPREPRGRMRRMIDRRPHDLAELRARARAVMLAARGDIQAPTEPDRERAAPAPESAAPPAPAV